jgi:stearoyl-CoA desaturase (delta-9 desaturase)
MIYGLLHLPYWAYIIIALGLTHITIASVTIFLHRCQAHRGLNLHPIPSHFFRFWLWLTTGMVTKEWVAVHRKHHAKVETEADPHSPQIYGLKRVLFRGVSLYRKSAQDPETLARYGAGTPDDWVERHIYSRYSGLGVSTMLVINLALFGIIGLAMWAIQMVWIPFFAAGVVNGVGHFWGYRNYETTDSSRNIFPWGVLIGGEELHNNHHTFGSSAKLSVKWWEFDLGWLYIQTLKLLGLAKVKKSIPKLHVDANRLNIDMESVRILIHNRFQIMDHYWHKVILPVLRDERSKAGKAGQSIFRHARRLLRREESLTDASAKQRVLKLLQDRQSLQIVCHFRTRLQGIWQRTASSQKELLESLQEWCRQAESSGIDVLEKFAVDLKQYSLAPA